MIIDCHTHIGYENDTQKQTEEELIKLMDEAKVDKSVVFPFGPVETPDQSFYEENEKMAKLKSNSRFIPFGRINQLARDAYDEIDHIKSLKLSGVKIHTARASLHNHTELLKKLNELGLPLLIHTGETYNAWIGHLKKLKYDGKIIIGHGGKGNFLQAVDLVNENENFYIETSLLSTRRISLVVEKVNDKSKVLFGSDAPFNPPLLEISKIRYACKDEEILKDVLGRNTERLLDG